MDIRHIWYSESFASTAIRLLLLPLSAIYWIGWSAYALVYRFGFKKGAEAHRPIIIVGNFTVGGTGKTPVTLAIADILGELGTPVVIGCSGYGAPRSEGASVAPDGPLEASEWGDEPAMIREALPTIPIIVGRNRVEAARICSTSFPDSVLLMDDGLQHLPLKADLRIAIQPSNLANRFVLPAGPYREPKWCQSADLILPGRFKIIRSLSHFERPDHQRINVEHLQGKEVHALCSIATPKEFVAGLEALGAVIKESTFLPDHDPMTDGKILNLLTRDDPTVVTTKDWVKLRSNERAETWNLFISYLNLEIEPRKELAAYLNERIQNAKAKA